MATTTYEPIATITASGSQSEVLFTSIPQTYTDLVVVIQATESGADGLDMRVGNGSIDTGNNYSFTILRGSGSAASSYRVSNYNAAQVGLVNSTIGTIVVNIQNYSNTNTYKTILTRCSNTNWTNNQTYTSVNLWRSTSAINQINFKNGSIANHGAGSTFTLYGIAKGAAYPPAAKATGGTITYGVGYTYHTFTSSGTFTPTQNLSADILVIAGGGGTTNANAGGGGAGGVAYAANYSLTASTGYTCSIGAGGSSNSTTNGSNSTFGSTLITATGGAYGAEEGNQGANGGSGGGGAGGGSGTRYGGSATQTSGTGYVGYGNAGGNSYTADYIAGGGGGAGAVGANGTSSAAGNGGVGLATWSSWGLATSTGQNISGTVYYAGGGGGGSDHSTNGTGGYGGGGGFRTDGTANTGGGAGGSGGTGARGGANGGSGIVIVRYAN
jgi:hypothetical protein